MSNNPQNKPRIDPSDILGTLVVVLLKAKNLNDKHQFYKQDVFCRVSLGGTTKRGPTDEKGGQTPEWDAEIRFDVLKDTSEKNRTLEVTVWAEEHKQDDLLGKATVDIAETLRTGEFDDWLPLSVEGTQRGDIYLEMTFFSTSAAPPRSNNATSANKNSNSVLAVPSANLQRRPSKLSPSERLSRIPASAVTRPQPNHQSSQGPYNTPYPAPSAHNRPQAVSSPPTASRISSQGRLPGLPESPGRGGGASDFEIGVNVPNFLTPGSGQRQSSLPQPNTAPGPAVSGPVPDNLRPGTSNAIKHNIPEPPNTRPVPLANPYDKIPAPKHSHSLTADYSQHPDRSHSPFPQPQQTQTAPNPYNALVQAPYNAPSTPLPYVQAGSSSTPLPYVAAGTPSPYAVPGTPSSYAAPSSYPQTAYNLPPQPQNGGTMPGGWQPSPGPSNVIFPVPGYSPPQDSFNNNYGGYNGSNFQPQRASGLPDPYLLARYQTPLPLPPSNNKPSDRHYNGPTQFPPPPFHPNHHPRSNSDFQASKDEERRKQTLMREEQAMNRRKEQEDKDLEMARKLDQELNSGL